MTYSVNEEYALMVCLLFFEAVRGGRARTAIDSRGTSATEVSVTRYKGTIKESNQKGLFHIDGLIRNIFALI